MLRFLIAASRFAAETLFAGIAVLATTPFTARFHEPIYKHWSHRVLCAGGVELQVEGAERLAQDQRYVFMANHQSYLDVPALVIASPVPLRFVAKRQLARIPLFGQAMQAIGTIPIDRKNHQEAVNKLREAQKSVGQRFSLVFFAEGTRSLDGELMPFKKGGVAMALALGVPIVPVTIAGAFEVMPRGKAEIRPGPVRISFGEPIAVGEEAPGERERLLEQVRIEVARTYERLRRLAG